MATHFCKHWFSFCFCFVCILYLPAGVNLSRLIVTDIACSRWARRATSCRQWRNLTSNQSPLQHPLEYILYQLSNTNRVNLLTPLQHPTPPKPWPHHFSPHSGEWAARGAFSIPVGPSFAANLSFPKMILSFSFFSHFLCCKMTSRRLIENCVRLQTPDWPGQARSWHSEIEGAVEQSLCPRHLLSIHLYFNYRRVQGGKCNKRAFCLSFLKSTQEKGGVFFFSQR